MADGEFGGTGYPGALRVGLGHQCRHTEHDESRTGIRRSQGGVDIRSGWRCYCVIFSTALTAAARARLSRVRGMWPISGTRVRGH